MNVFVTEQFVLHPLHLRKMGAVEIIGAEDCHVIHQSTKH